MSTRWPGGRSTEVAFLYGLANLAFGLADVFVSPVENVQVAIRAGTFDQVLLRPVSPLVQVVTDGFSARRLGKLAEGMLVFGFAIAAADIDWTVRPRRDDGRGDHVRLGHLQRALGGDELHQLLVGRGREAANAVTYGGSFLAQYPLGIYGPWLRRGLAYAVPVAFANYFPATYVLGRDDRLGAPTGSRSPRRSSRSRRSWLARSAWRVGVRHYRSTGS